MSWPKPGMMTFAVIMMLLFPALGALATSGQSNEWPQFRANSQNTGSTSGLAPRHGQVLWTYKIGAATKSSPTVADGKLFIGDNKGTIWALDAETGQFLWSYETHGAVESTPTYLDGRVYVGSDDMNMTALNATNGKLIWSFKTNGTIKSSVSVADAHDNTTGAPMKVLVFGSYDSFLYGLDTNGKELWRFKAASFIHGKPGIYDGKAFTCTCDKTLYGIDVETGQKVFNISFGDFSAASPAAVDGFIYATARGGKVFAVSLANSSIRWEVDTKKTIESSPAVGSGLVVIGNDGVEVVGINASNGNKVWSFNANGAVDSSAAIVDGLVLIGDGSHYLHALNVSSGIEVWNYMADGVIDSSPAVAYGKVYFGTGEGTVYALGDTKPLIRFISPKSWDKVKDKFFVQLEIFGSGLTSVQVGTDGSNWTSALRNSSAGSAIWETHIETKKMKRGEHLLEARATNGTGSSSTSIYIIVDRPRSPDRPIIPGFDFPMVLGVLIFVTVTIRMIRMKFPGDKDR